VSARRLRELGREQLADYDQVTLREHKVEAMRRDGELFVAETQGGATPQTRLAEDLGVRLSKNGYIAVDTEQKTSVPGIYAAGDVTRLHSHQVSTAVHEGGQAASAANYVLYPPEQKDE